MKFDKIVSFGDSWTVGEGFDYKLEQTLKHADGERDFFGGNKELYDLRVQHSYTKHLADSYNIPFEVYATSGGSNETIMNNFFKFRKSIDDKTLVVFMWSSKLRDRILYLPKLYAEDNRWLVWSKDLLKSEANRFWKDVDNEWDKEFRKYFYTNLFDESLLDTYTAMYKISLQHFCKYYNIPYIMCNAFEKSEPNKNVNKEFYYKYDSSIYDDLKNIDGDIWEDKERFTKEQYLNGLHPNNEGYKIIANILKKFIDDKFI